MPLSVAVVPLELQIAAALRTARDVGQITGADPDAIINILANQLSVAIHTYVMQAIVNVTVVNTAVVGAGATGPIVGTGIGVGTGALL